MSRRLVLAACAVGLVCGPTAPTAEGGDGVTIAVVPAGGRRSPSDAAVAQLEVALSSEKGIDLVERALVRKALAEQVLGASGLVDQATALRLGKLIGADLFVFVENLPEARPPVCRMPIVETKTGIALGGELLEEATLAKDASVVIEAVRAAVGKLGVPPGERRYVGLLGFRNEEPGRFLDGLAEALGMFLEHDLAASPNVVVLDRNHLTRLREEKELAGIELELRTSALLVEGGVRRGGVDKELSVTVHIHGLAGGAAEKLCVTASSEDHAAARRALARAVLGKLGAWPVEERRAEPEREAATFVSQVPALISAGEHDAALRAAEAAYTLCPGYETSFWAARAWDEVAKASVGQTLTTRTTGGTFKRTVLIEGRNMDVEDVPKESLVRVLASHLRARKLGLEFYRMHARRYEEGEEERVQLQLRGGKPITDLGKVSRSIAFKSDDPELARLRRQIADIDREIFRFGTGYYARHCPEAEKEYWATWVSALREFRAMYPGSPELQVRFVRKGLEVAVDPPVAVGKGPPTPERIVAMTALPWVLRLASSRASETEVERRALVDLCRELAGHRDPLVRICAYCGLAIMNEDVSAAKAALDALLKDLPPEHPYRAGRTERTSSERIVSGVLASPLGLLALREPAAYDAYSRRVFIPMIEGGDGRRLNEWMVTGPFREWLDTLASSERVAEADAFARKAVGALSRERRQTAMSNVRWLEQQRIKYARILGEAGGTDPVWAEYEIQPVRARPSPETVSLRLHGRRLYLLDRSGRGRDWSLALWSVEFPDGEGVLRHGTVSASIEGDLYLRVTSSATADGRLYVGTTSGLFIFPLEGGPARLVTEEDGLPGNRVESLAALQGRLYLGFGETVGTEKSKAGLACFDIRAGTWNLEASTAATEVRCGLDGGTNYEVSSILADENRRCLWLAVREPRGGRAGRMGLWRYAPETKELEHVLQDHEDATALAWAGGRILCRDGVSVALIDPDHPARSWLVGGGPEARDPLFGCPFPMESAWPVILEGDRAFALKRIPTRWLYLLRKGLPPAPLVRTPDGREFDDVDFCIRTDRGMYAANWKAAYLIRQKGR